MKAFIGAKIYVEGGGIERTNLVFSDGIVQIGADVPDAEELALPQDAVVLPGFIDEHIHGAGGADAMDGTEESLSVIARTVAKEGTTRFLATTMTQSKERILQAVSAVKAYRASNRSEGAGILGVHLEGPFISPKHVGAQPLEYVRDADEAWLEEVYSASGNSVKMVTLAPEKAGMGDFIRYLTKKGITVSVGHTDAKYAEIVSAEEAGARCITHTYNAQTALHHREIGTVGAALLEDGLYTELIADTIHVSVPAIRLLVKNKPKDKLILITDAMRAKGVADGVSELGGQTVYVKNGEARLADGTLAGSVLKMNVAFKNMAEKVGVPFLQAVDFLTINPARNLKLEKDHGSIKVGKRADFTVLDGEYNVLYTVRDGKIIYRKGE
jgi:N-acetylglucosamine-6-phosphate deacetylase